MSAVEQGPVTHTLIGRACDADFDGACAQLKITFHGEPSDEVVADYASRLRGAFKDSFGGDPARVGVAVLPYSEQHDGEES